MNPDTGCTFINQGQGFLTFSWIPPHNHPTSVKGELVWGKPGLQYELELAVCTGPEKAWWCKGVSDLTVTHSPCQTALGLACPGSSAGRSSGLVLSIHQLFRHSHLWVTNAVLSTPAPTPPFSVEHLINVPEFTTTMQDGFPPCQW